MKFCSTVALILLCTSFAVSQEWWKHANIYQVAPLSFKDSNGDGKGDIQGIISKLDYFVETNIDVLMIGPIFESRFVDFGYDVTNFKNVDPIFGTISDVEELFAKAKQRGIKIILDFIPNHTSSTHEWFTKSENQERGFEDFYIWHDGIPQINNGRPLQPNSWRAEYGGFSWKWSETRNAYYYHKFDVQQPDLNLQEERVLKELDSVLLFWLEKGADGFRVDAVSQLIEDPAFLDNPDISKDLEQTYQLIDRWSTLLKDYGGDEKILVPQVWNSPLKSLMKYTEYNAQIPMNFILINELNNTSNANDFKRTIDDYLKALPQGAVPNWLLGSHDHNRVASRMGKERVDGLMILLQTLPGISFTYYGDEIGMEDNIEISWQDTTDPQACNTDPTVYQYLSRDVARTPFQWNGETNSGFTTAAKPWLPVHSEYDKVNLQRQMTEDKSHYKLFKELLEFRKEDAMRDGDFHSRALSDMVFSYSRTLENATYVIAINLGNRVERVDASVLKTNLKDESQIHVASTTSGHQAGEIVNIKSLNLQPYAAVIITNDSQTVKVSLFVFLASTLLLKIVF